MVTVVIPREKLAQKLGELGNNGIHSTQNNDGPKTRTGVLNLAGGIKVRFSYDKPTGKLDIEVTATPFLVTKSGAENMIKAWVEAEG